MSPWRRRRRDADDPVRLGFAPVARGVDAAQRALLRAVPTPRDPGIPLPEALRNFERALDEVIEAMPGWRRAGLEALWDRCDAAVRESRVQAGRLAGERPLEFEALNDRVGDVLSPLEAFVDAERAIRKMSRR